MALESRLRALFVTIIFYCMKVYQVLLKATVVMPLLAISQNKSPLISTP
jgi:hypothetical protein